MMGGIPACRGNAMAHLNSNGSEKVRGPSRRGPAGALTGAVGSLEKTGQPLEGRHQCTSITAPGWLEPTARNFFCCETSAIKTSCIWKSSITKPVRTHQHASLQVIARDASRTRSARKVAGSKPGEKAPCRRPTGTVSPKSALRKTLPNDYWNGDRRGGFVICS